MANELESGGIQRSTKICGIALVVLMAAGLVYFAPLAVLARIEKPTGEKRYLSTSIMIQSMFSAPGGKVFRPPPIAGHELKNTLLNKIYAPVLKAAGGSESEQNKLAKFILGVE